MGASACRLCCQNDGSINHDDLTDLSMEIKDGIGHAHLIRISVPWFTAYSEQDLLTLANAFEEVIYTAGSIIIREDEKNDHFYLVKSGCVVENAESDDARELEAGAYFGLDALLQTTLAIGTVTAKTDSVLLRLARVRYQNLERCSDTPKEKRRMSIGNADVSADHIQFTSSVQTFKSGSPDDHAAIRTILKECPDKSFTDEQIEILVRIAFEMTFKANDVIVAEGHVDSAFYIIKKGSVVKQARDSSKEVLGRNVIFGDVTFVSCEPSEFSFCAKSDAIVWRFARSDYKEVHMDNLRVNDKGIIDIVSSCEWVKESQIDLYGTTQLAAAMVRKTWKKNDVMFTQGEKIKSMHVLVSGDINTTRLLSNDKKERSSISTDCGKQTPTLGKQVLTGDGSLTYTYSAIVSSERAETLCLDLVTFCTMVELEVVPVSFKAMSTLRSNSIPAVNRLSLVKLAGGNRSSQIEMDIALSEAMATKNAAQARVRQKDLKVISLLSYGGVGKVEMVTEPKGKAVYALKTVSKGLIVRKKLHKQVRMERNCLLLCGGCPFIVEMYEAYADDKAFFFLLEIALGGELFRVYQKQKMHGKEDCAQFYTAGILLAFEHMHSLQVIYRDLKPENVLLDAEGKVKVTDMGFAKFTCSKTFTTCGTCEYFAPEMIESRGHYKGLDWWTFGILLYELMMAQSPFVAPTPAATYAKVLKGMECVKFRPTSSQSLKDIIGRLLVFDPNKRLPMLDGVDGLKRHSFYHSVDWPSMCAGTGKVPFKPSVGNKKDGRNFGVSPDEIKRIPVMEPYVPDGTGWDDDFATID